MNTKFTPGPWSVEDPMGSDIGLWIVEANKEAYEWTCIASVPRDDEDTRSAEARFITKAEQRANAQLLAAAPTMYEALESAPILSKYHGHAGFESERFIADYLKWWEMRSYALTKAGRQS